MSNLKFQNVFHAFTIHWTHFVSLLNHKITKVTGKRQTVYAAFVPLLNHNIPKESAILYQNSWSLCTFVKSQHSKGSKLPFYMIFKDSGRVQ